MYELNTKKSFVEVVVTQPTTDFTIGFEFDEGVDVYHVLVDGVPAKEAGYTTKLKNSAIVELTPAVPNGIVRIYRETDIDSNLYKFTAGALFEAHTMDANFNQILHSQQETRDGFTKLASDVYPLVNGLEGALDKADSASKAAQDAAKAAEEAAEAAAKAAQVTRSASQVIDASGLSQQAINNNFVTPEMFGAVANSWETDNTAALNAAFATGKDVYSTPDKIYTCNGNLRTKGQRCVGGWKIRSSKNVVGGAWLNTSNTYPTPCDFTYLQGVYCAYAYDLAELFAIRDLGYNTLLHYGGMHINGYDMDGTVQNLLDNAKTAGLQVFLGTQNSLNGMSLTDFVNAHKHHPAVLGFLIADEPTHNGITVAQQATNIATVKALTNKPLACSDFTFDAFTEVLADGYDYIFGDIYNGESETVQQTLYKMRAWLGLTAKRHPNAKVLPAVMGFRYNGSVPLETIIQTSRIFAKSCGGNFSCFVWDGLGDTNLTNSIRDTAALQGLSRDICAYKTNVYNIPECYAWGTLSDSTQEQYGLKDVLEHLVRADPNTVGGYEGIRCYPAQMNGNPTESDRTTPYLSTGVGLAAIWFKGTYGAYISDIHMKKYNHLTVHSGMLERGTAGVSLGVRGSTTGGYGVGAQIISLPIDGSVATQTFDYESDTDMFCIKYDCSVDPVYYRTYVRGVYITSDW